MAWGSKSSRKAGRLPANWPSIRARVLARDGRKCVSCGAPATDVDHIGAGDDHSLDNLRSLCRSCHMRRTGRDGGKAPHRPRLPTRRPPEPHPGIKRDTSTD